jgi:transcriptional regulator with XRE-family HTH domain
MTHASRTTWTLDLDRLERARILRGWTRRELARVAHVDEGTLSDLFRTRRRPTFGTITAVCSCLGIGLGEIIRFEDHERT